MDGGQSPFYILGLMSFFPNYYTVFDLDANKIGFAPSKHASKRIHDLYEYYGKQDSLISTLKDSVT
jgi:hypothetical protein